MKTNNQVALLSWSFCNRHSFVWNNFFVKRRNNFRTSNRDDSLIQCWDLQGAICQSIHQCDFVCVNQIVPFASISWIGIFFFLDDENQIRWDNIGSFITFINKRDLGTFLPSRFDVDNKILRVVQKLVVFVVALPCDVEFLDTTIVKF